MKLPDKVVVFSKVYKIRYCKNPVDVDSKKRESLWGEVDNWDNTMRIFVGEGQRDYSEIVHTILHECVHVIQYQLKLDENCTNEHYIELFSLGLTDLLKQNKFFSYIYKGDKNDKKN